MHSRTVDARGGLLLQEGGEAVIGGELLDDLHGDQVLVDPDGVDPVLRGELELAGRDLPVPGLEWDARLGTRVLDLLHAVKGRSVGGQGGGM